MEEFEMNSEEKRILKKIQRMFPKATEEDVFRSDDQGEKKLTLKARWALDSIGMQEQHSQK